MPAETTATTSPPTRRERQRQATNDEIVSVARQLLREHDAISLRAIAQEMGMTPPALYRYVDGYDELIALVATAIFDDMIASMTEAVASYDVDDPAGRLVSAAVAFRQWALGHPEEFGLIFANRATAKGKSPDDPLDGGLRFAVFFSTLYIAMWDKYHFELPGPDDLPAGAIAELERARDEGVLPCEFPGAPIGLNWIFMRAWVRLYGIVTLEVFGHLDEPLIRSGAMFRAMMADNGAELGFGQDLSRVQEVMEAELSRPGH
jgi:AcrR family transcriptional regulator